MRLLRPADIALACPMADAIDAVGRGFAALSEGKARVPVRASVPLAGGAVALTMPASLDGGPHWSVKVVTVAPANSARGLPVVAGTVLLGDAATGLPLALLDGTALTALRTGAAGGLAARLLARPDSAVVALFGAGAQARTQLEAVRVALGERLREVRVVSRDGASARDLAVSAEAADRRVAYRATSAEDAVRGADVVITATSSASPVFAGRSLGPGAHVTAVGSFRPTTRELDEDTMRGARIVVDQRASALEEAGELQGIASEALVEIGEIVARRAPGRRSAQERTIFKSVGNAVQDLVVASLAYERAAASGLGQEIAWP